MDRADLSGLSMGEALKLPPCVVGKAWPVAARPASEPTYISVLLLGWIFRLF